MPSPTRATKMLLHTQRFTAGDGLGVSEGLPVMLELQLGEPDTDDGRDPEAVIETLAVLLKDPETVAVELTVADPVTELVTEAVSDELAVIDAVLPDVDECVDVAL